MFVVKSEIFDCRNDGTIEIFAHISKSGIVKVKNPTVAFYDSVTLITPIKSMQNITKFLIKTVELLT